MGHLPRTRMLRLYAFTACFRWWLQTVLTLQLSTDSLSHKIFYSPLFYQTHLFFEKESFDLCTCHKQISLAFSIFFYQRSDKSRIRFASYCICHPEQIVTFQQQICDNFCQFNSACFALVCNAKLQQLVISRIFIILSYREDN